MNNKIHCHDDFLKDHTYDGVLTDEILMKWHRDSYSTSKHLLSFYNLPIVNGAKRILEVGFGRSTFVFAKVAAEINAQFVCVDSRDFSPLFNDEERKVVDFRHQLIDINDSTFDGDFDFMFLDFLSDNRISEKSCTQYLNYFLRRLSPEGILLVHDTNDERYSVGNAVHKWVRKKNGFLGSEKLAHLRIPYNYGLSIISRRSSQFKLHDGDPFLKKPEQ